MLQDLKNLLSTDFIIEDDYITSLSSYNTTAIINDKVVNIECKLEVYSFDEDDLDVLFSSADDFELFDETLFFSVLDFYIKELNTSFAIKFNNDNSLSLSIPVDLNLDSVFELNILDLNYIIDIKKNSIQLKN